jgi:hypothetical protein
MRDVTKNIKEDGTYLLSRDGKVYPVELKSGYVVGVKSLANDDLVPNGLFGRWTDHKEGFDWNTGYEINDNVIYWDEVELIDNVIDALFAAKSRGELAIWDNANQCEVRVDTSSLF